MSRRKQSNPRQIKRLLQAGAVGLLSEGGVVEETDSSLLEQLSDDVISSRSGKEEAEPAEAQTRESLPSPPIERQEEWDGPEELGVIQEGAGRRACSRQALSVGTTWGPYEGKVEMTSSGSDTSSTQAVAAVISGGPRWLQDVASLTTEEVKANCVVYSKDGQIWIITTREIPQGEELKPYIMDLNPWHQLANHSSPSEAMWPAQQSYASEGMYPAARLLESMQLLPQQATMATMLPHAIVNKDIFPCKACGIWFRSERNHQAHLLFYCSGRQNQTQTPEPFSTLPHHMTLPYPQGLGAGRGQQAVEMLLNIHNGIKREGAAVSGGQGLRCTVCDHMADNPASLQHHILSHLSSSGHLCPLCHLSFQTACDLDSHTQTHTRHPGTRSHLPVRPNTGAGSPQQASKCETGGEKEGGMDKEVFQSVENRPPSWPGNLLQKEHSLLKKERPDSTPSASTASRPPSRTSTPTPSPRSSCPGPSSTPSDPKVSRAHPQVKSEPSSPRPASSPIHPSLRPAFPIPQILPHFPFLQDMTSPTGPQASEILAKMSELVHHRLRQGAGAGAGGNSNYPSLLYSPGHGPLLSKGTTCFQCSISFSSLENYLVHKKHYCQGRWTPSRPQDGQALLDKPPATGSPEAGSRASMTTLGVEGVPSNPTSSLLTLPGLAVAGLDHMSTDRKWEGKKMPARTPLQLDERPCIQGEVEGLEGEGELPGKTTCQACKITFSRTENFLVHKRYYCATRHDPPARRNHGNKMAASATQRTVRTRRRRKNYDVSHPANQELRLPLTHPHFLGIRPIGGAGMYQGIGDVFGTHGNQYPQPRYGMFLGVEPKHPEASLPTPRSALSSRCSSLVQSEMAMPPTDTPMDLSRKQAWQPGTGKVASAQTPRMHQGRDYHKCVPCQVNFDRVEDYLQHQHSSCPAQGKRGRAVSTSGSPKSGLGQGPEEEEDHEGRGGLTSKSRHTPVLQTCSPPPFKKPCPEEEPPQTTTVAITPAFYTLPPCTQSSATVVRQREEEAVRQSPTEACEGREDQPIPEDACQETLGSLTQHSRHADSPQSQNGHRLDGSVTGAIEEDADVNSDLSRGQGSGSGAPSSPASPSKSVLCVRRGVAGVSVKYCRPCDIQFNNLSNFITHKKFYCSSHTQHVQ